MIWRGAARFIRYIELIHRRLVKIGQNNSCFGNPIEQRGVAVSTGGKPFPRRCDLYSSGFSIPGEPQGAGPGRQWPGRSRAAAIAMTWRGPEAGEPGVHRDRDALRTACSTARPPANPTDTPAPLLAQPRHWLRRSPSSERQDPIAQTEVVRASTLHIKWSMSPELSLRVSQYSAKTFRSHWPSK